MSERAEVDLDALERELREPNAPNAVTARTSLEIIRRAKVAESDLRETRRERDELRETVARVEAVKSEWLALILPAEKRACREQSALLAGKTIALRKFFKDLDAALNGTATPLADAEREVERLRAESDEANFNCAENAKDADTFAKRLQNCSEMLGGGPDITAGYPERGIEHALARIRELLAGIAAVPVHYQNSVTGPTLSGGIKTLAPAMRYCLEDDVKALLAAKERPI